MPRLQLLACAFTVTMTAQVPPVPERGEYTCIQTNLTLAMPLPGLPPSTTVTAAPGPFGNLVLDGAGKYRMTVGRDNAGDYRFDRETGRVTFEGVLAPMSVNYGTRGTLTYFEFRGEGVAFSCSVKSRVDHGETRTRTNEPVASQNSLTNSHFTGRLYFADHRGVFRVDLATGKETALGLSGNFDIGLDGSVVYVNSRGDMILTNENGSGTVRVPVYGSKSFSPKLSPDGSRIAYYGGRKPRGLEAAMEAAFTNARLEPLVVSRDGKLLAAFGTDYAQPCWTPDGRVVVAGARSAPGILNGNAVGLYISDPALRRLTRLPLDFDAPHSPAVSPDGKRIAFANGPNLWVANIDGSSPRKIYEGNSKFVMFPAWSPDGSALTFVDNQVVGIVSLSSGEELAVKAKDGQILRSTSEVLWLP